MGSKKFNWGIIGPGVIAEKFTKDIKLLDNINLHAVASRDADRASAFAQEFGFQVSYASYEDLVKDPLVDVIYIATPHALHCEHALLCLNHQKPVLCEKPMALNTSQVNQMINAARKNNTFLMEGMWSAFFPLIQEVKQLIAEGAIGRVESIEADFGFKADFNPTGRLFDKKLGGGSLLDVGVYPLFLSLFLLGSPERIESEMKLTSTGVDESCLIQLYFAGGAVAKIFSSISEDTAIEAFIKGTEGSIHIHNRWFRPRTFELKNKKGTFQKTSSFEGTGFQFEAMEVMRCLESGLKEHPLMSHAFSLEMADVMEKVCLKHGIIY